MKQETTANLSFFHRRDRRARRELKKQLHDIRKSTSLTTHLLLCVFLRQSQSFTPAVSAFSAVK
jgi:hypothetical protein